MEQSHFHSRVILYVHMCQCERLTFRFPDNRPLVCLGKEILEFRPKFQSVYDRWKVIVEESKTKSSKLSKTKRRPN